MSFGLTDDQSLLSGKGLTHVPKGPIASKCGLETNSDILKANRLLTAVLVVDLPGFSGVFSVHGGASLHGRKWAKDLPYRNSGARIGTGLIDVVILDGTGSKKCSRSQIF